MTEVALESVRDSVLNTRSKKKDKIKSYITRWLNDFNMKKRKTFKLWKKIQEDYLADVRVEKDFLNMIQQMDEL